MGTFSIATDYEILPVEGDMVDVPFIQAFIAKHNNLRYVFEYYSGRKISSVGSKSAMKAIEIATSVLNHHGKDKTEKSIGFYPLVND